MKKIIILLITICLFGCSEPIDSKLAKLGYSKTDIETIKTYSEEIQSIFVSEYNPRYIDLMHVSGFDISKLDEYLKYDTDLSNNEIVSLVNEGMYKEEYDKYKEIFKNEYYLEKNKQLYIDNLDKYEDVRSCIEAVNTMTYLPYYTNIVATDVSKDYLMLINKYHALSSEYEPDDLVDIDSKYGKGRTRKEVYEQYCKLADEAFSLGYDFKICSAYRAYDYQEGLYEKYLNEDAGGQASVDTYSARPGHSEHQSGLCLDLTDSIYGMDDFGLSDSSKWINENCYRYGFIIRYTMEKEDITGYQAEPWQIRYVGSAEIAKDIMNRNITFDEYYACFIEG